MKFENLNIVLISSDSWYSLPVSKHHYARELAKKNRVYFINPPDSTHLEDEQVGNILVVNNYKRVRGISMFPTFLRKQLQKIEVRSILEKVQGGNVDIVWSYDTSRLYYLDLFETRLKIAHIVDFTEHFYFEELVSSADFCFATSDSITDKMKDFNENVFKINHGFAGETPGVNDLDEFSKEKCVYIGNLTIPYLDWGVVYQLAKNFPAIEFTFIGSRFGKISEENERLLQMTEELENTIFKGKMSPAEVLEEMNATDFCLMAYDFEKYPLQLQNPHKMMQYLGSGRPIFSSYTHEFREVEEVFMYEVSAKVVDAFSNFIEDKKNLFSKEAAIKRINFARENSYMNQLSRIETIVNEHNNRAN